MCVRESTCHSMHGDGGGQRTNHKISSLYTIWALKVKLIRQTPLKAKPFHWPEANRFISIIVLIRFFVCFFRQGLM